MFLKNRNISSKIKRSKVTEYAALSNSYTMGCPPVRRDNPRALASGLSHVRVDKHGITILYHLHQGRTCISRYFVIKLVRVV